MYWKSIGFAVIQLAGRIWINTPEGTEPPRTHVFLCVSVNETRWLVDCGIGGATPTAPINMDALDVPQTTPHEDRRVIRVDKALVPIWMHQAKYGDRWIDVCEFTGEPMSAIDQEMGHYWASTHPESRFRKNLIVAIAHRDGTRSNLRNRTYIHRRGGEVLQQIEIESRTQLSDLLQERFGIELPSTCDLTILGLD